jgi:hypothetical protein
MGLGFNVEQWRIPSDPVTRHFGVSWGEFDTDEGTPEA